MVQQTQVFELAARWVPATRRHPPRACECRDDTGGFGWSWIGEAIRLIAIRRMAQYELEGITLSMADIFHNIYSANDIVGLTAQPPASVSEAGDSAAEDNLGGAAAPDLNSR